MQPYRYAGGRALSVWSVIGAIAAVVLRAGDGCYAQQRELFPGEMHFRPGFEPIPESLIYSLGLPDYVTPGNVVAESSSAIGGVLTGAVATTVYTNQYGRLTFAYRFTGGPDLAAPIVRAAIGGDWLHAGEFIFDAGSDTSGESGTGDPEPDWTDGAPYLIERDAEPGYAPSIAWRWFGIGSALGAGDTPPSSGSRPFLRTTPRLR